MYSVRDRVVNAFGGRDVCADFECADNSWGKGHDLFFILFTTFPFRFLDGDVNFYFHGCLGMEG